MQPEQLGRLDAWIEANHPGRSRPEAIREMVKTMLDIVEKDRA